MSSVSHRPRLERATHTGHRSAASFPTGPVMAEPFISPLGLTICARRKSASLSPRPAPPVHRTTYNASIVLEVQVGAIGSLPWFALPHHHRRHDLLPQLGPALLDGCHDHVADAGRGKAVEAGADAGDRDNVQVAGTRVVAAVHDGAAALGR